MVEKRGGVAGGGLENTAFDSVLGAVSSIVDGRMVLSLDGAPS